MTGNQPSPTVEAQRVLSFLASLPTRHSSVDRATLREIMLTTGGQLMACGSLYEIEQRSLGAGVYRVSLRRAP